MEVPPRSRHRLICSRPDAWLWSSSSHCSGLAIRPLQSEHGRLDAKSLNSIILCGARNPVATKLQILMYVMSFDRIDAGQG